MHPIKCTEPCGNVTIFRSAKKACEHIKLMNGEDHSEYKVKQAARGQAGITGFQLSYATAEDLREQECGTASDGDQDADGEAENAIAMQSGANCFGHDRDRLAEGFRSFDIGVVVMDRHDTPVPHGFFYATAMCEHAGKEPKNFLTHSRTVKCVENLAKLHNVQTSDIAIAFHSGPYRGTWVHRDLATRLAIYCDDSCQLETSVGMAIRALADRTPMPAPAPSMPVSFEAQGILAETEALVKKAAAYGQVVDQKERDLHITKQYSALERSHLKQVGKISERQAAAKRKQEEQSSAQAKKHAKTKAEIQAAKDHQHQLRRQASQQPSATRLSFVPHRNAASNLRTGSTPMSGTFVMDEAVHKAAEKMGIAYSQVIKFMRAKHGNKTGYQKVLEDTHLVKKGIQVRVNGNIGYYPVGVYPKSKLDAAVNWIRRKYTAQG